MSKKTRNVNSRKLVAHRRAVNLAKNLKEKFDSKTIKKCPDAHRVVQKWTKSSHVSRRAQRFHLSSNWDSTASFRSKGASQDDESFIGSLLGKNTTSSPQDHSVDSIWDRATAQKMKDTAVSHDSSVKRNYPGSSIFEDKRRQAAENRIRMKKDIEILDDLWNEVSQVIEVKKFSERKKSAVEDNPEEQQSKCEVDKKYEPVQTSTACTSANSKSISTPQIEQQQQSNLDEVEGKTDPSSSSTHGTPSSSLLSMALKRVGLSSTVDLDSLKAGMNTLAQEWFTLLENQSTHPKKDIQCAFHELINSVQDPSLALWKDAHFLLLLGFLAELLVQCKTVDACLLRLSGIALRSWIEMMCFPVSGVSSCIEEVPAESRSIPLHYCCLIFHLIQRNQPDWSVHAMADVRCFLHFVPDHVYADTQHEKARALLNTLRTKFDPPMNQEELDSIQKNTAAHFGIPEDEQFSSITASPSRLQLHRPIPILRLDPRTIPSEVDPLALDHKRRQKVRRTGKKVKQEVRVLSDVRRSDMAQQQVIEQATREANRKKIVGELQAQQSMIKYVETHHALGKSKKKRK